MALPPLHRIDAPAGFVLVHDEAWDWEKINAEMDSSDAPHPVSVYFAGLSRFDLDTVRGYFKPGESPAVFRLRRLSVADYARAVDILQREGENTAAVFAFERGLVAVEGVDGLSDIDATARPRLTPQEHKRISRVIEGWVFDVGKAIVKLSEPLTAAEGKAFGS